MTTSEPTTTDSQPRFGRLLTAMVTPFSQDGALDLAAAGDLARYLVEQQTNDGVVVNGTTGESPTTTEDEKFATVDAVLQAVGDRAHVIAGVGSFDTAHTVRMARRAKDVGAHGLLVVCPYYSRPTQAGIVAHFEAVADATDLPVMMYDIPGRTGVAMAPETLERLAAHPNIIAVKDAKGDLVSSAQVIAATDLDYYSGDDALTLPLLSIGAKGVVGTSTHFTGRQMRALIEAYVAGDPVRALQVHQQWVGAFDGVFAAPGVTMVKATLAQLGISSPVLRLPMVEPDRDVVLRYVAKVNGTLD